MKNPVYHSLLSTLLGVLALHCTTSGTPQDAASPFAQTRRSAPRGVTYVQETNPLTGSVERFHPLRTIRKSGTHQLRELMTKYKNAERDEKDELETSIRSMLDEQYDAFLVQNEKQIKQLQERLNKLKDQLDRRRSAKNKMVDLEFERLANEAEGLIWPDQQHEGFFQRAGGYETRPAFNPASPKAPLPPGAAR